MSTEKYNDLISQGISLMSSENYPAAKECFEKAIEADNKSFDAYTHLGNACANLELLDEAVEAFKKALVVQPSSGETYFSIGNIHLLKDDKLKAVEFYNKAEAAGFKESQMYQIMTGIFFDANDTAQALRNITRAIAAAPLDGELRLFKTRIFLSENRFDEALDSLDEMEKVLPDAFEAYDMTAQIYCGLKKYDEAIKACETGIKRFPEDANLRLSKLKVLIEFDKIADAAQLLVEMKANGMYEQTLKESVIQESIIEIKNGNNEQAISALVKANESLGNDDDLLYLIMDLQGKTEKYADALKTSEILMNMETSIFYSATAMYFHAHALDKTGEAEEAKKEYRKIASHFRKLTIGDPAFYEGYIYRLLSHAKIGEYEQALALSDYLENMYPDKSDAHAFRYFIYKEKGDLEMAEKEKALAKSINPDLNM